MRYEYVVFDLDGTLIDTLEDMRDSVNHVMRAYGWPERTLAEIRAFVGNGLRWLIELAVPQKPCDDASAEVGSGALKACDRTDGITGAGNAAFSGALIPRPAVDDTTFERCFAEFKAYYAAHCMVKTAPYEGIPEAVRAIRDAGIRCAVVTNKMQAAADDIIRSFFGDTIDIVIGQVDGMPQKPAPDGVWLAMERLGADPAAPTGSGATAVNCGADPAKTVYVGDSEVDCLTARNAGLPVIGVTWGFRDRSVLEANAADFVIDSPAEILPVLLG